MKLLFLSSWFPYPPDNGAKIRTYYLLKSLSEHYDVFLISLSHSDYDINYINQINNICNLYAVHRIKEFKPNSFKSFFGYFSQKPRSFIDTFDKNIAHSVKKALAKISPNVIIVSTMGMVEYAPKKHNALMVLDQHNCEYAILKRAAEKIKNPIKRLKAELGWKKYARWESKVSSWFDLITEVSEIDKLLMQNASKNRLNIEVVPNGVDCSIYKFDEWNPNKNQLIYNGALTYSANYSAVLYYIKEIHPLIKNKFPNIKLLVTGNYDNVDITPLKNNEAVKLVGYVESMPEILKKSAICIVPLFDGGGTRLKILESMASGVPVISTSIGIEGINAHNMNDAIIADNPSEFALAIEKLLTDYELANKIRSNARNLVINNYDWNIITKRYINIINEYYKKKKKFN